MATEKQIARRERIEDAAYALLAEVGYKSASLLAIAQRAGTSNETLYNWYGNKQALFRSLVETNAAAARQLLDEALQRAADPLLTLTALGPVLLTLVTGQKAIILNRAAGGDVYDTATLGSAIARFGRDTIAPLLRDLLQQAHAQGLIQCENPTEAADIYFRLLIGDLQIRRVIGAIPELTSEDIEQRAQQALALFLRLYAPAAHAVPLNASR